MRACGMRTCCSTRRSSRTAAFCTASRASAACRWRAWAAKHGLRDQSDRGGSQGTGLHRRRADVGGRDADQVAAQHQDHAAGGGRRDPTDWEGGICVRCAGHACRLRVGNRKPSDLKPTMQMACCQKATRNEAKGKHASKSRKPHRRNGPHGVQPAGVTLAPLCQTFGN